MMSAMPPASAGATLPEAGAARAERGTDAALMTAASSDARSTNCRRTTSAASADAAATAEASKAFRFGNGATRPIQLLPLASSDLKLPALELVTLEKSRGLPPLPLLPPQARLPVSVARAVDEQTALVEPRDGASAVQSGALLLAADGGSLTQATPVSLAPLLLERSVKPFVPATRFDSTLLLPG